MTWLRQIAQNNERDWFLAHKPTFESHVKGATAWLVEALNARLRRFAPEYVADPRKALSRIYRDVRFSADKTPYRTHLGAWFRRPGGTRESAAAFWIAVSAQGLDVAGGCVAPDGPHLARLRAHLDEHHACFDRLCRRKPLRDAMGDLQGVALKGMPRGWPADHPAAALLQRKQLYFQARLPVRVVTSPKLVGEIARRFKLLTPFVAFLDEAFASRT